MSYPGFILPALLRREQSLLLGSLLVFGVCVLGAFLLVQSYPGLVYLVYGEYQLQELTRAYQPEVISLGRHLARELWRDVLFYFLNNSLVGLQLFLAGLLLGLGTLVLLVYGGISLGLLMGHIHASGLGDAMWPAIIGHSAPEVFATVLSATAGFRLGLWLFDCIRARGLVGAWAVVADVGHLLLLALLSYALGALVEAAWSHHPQVSAGQRYGLGVCIWLLFGVYGLYALRFAPRR